MVTEAQKRAVARYDKENTKKILLKLNRVTDADILDQLQSVGNKQGYIKKLIRQDINNNVDYRINNNVDYIRKDINKTEV